MFILLRAYSAHFDSDKANFRGELKLSPEQNGRQRLSQLLWSPFWPLDEIKQFLGLLENYYKRIIK